MGESAARAIGRIALGAAVLLGAAATARADGGIMGVLTQVAGGATDGSINPLDSNNKLGFHIDTGSILPPARPGTVTTFDDPTPPPAYKVDPSGNVEILGANGQWVRTNRRAQIRWRPNGRAFWVYNGKTYPAAPQFDNHALQAQYQNKLAADQERARENAEKAAAMQKLAGIDQSLFNAPQDQVDSLIQRLPPAEQFADLKQLAILINVCRQNGIESAGFGKLYASLDRAVAQAKANAQAQANANPNPNGPPQVNVNVNVPPPGNAGGPQPDPGPPQGGGAPQEIWAGNLGIYYTPIGYPDGTFGARITRPPAPNSPAGQVGLEVGDTIYELDGQRFTRPEDVLAHKDQTTVDVINVRNNQSVQFNVFIP